MPLQIGDQACFELILFIITSSQKGHLYTFDKIFTEFKLVLI